MTRIKKGGVQERAGAGRGTHFTHQRMRERCCASSSVRVLCRVVSVQSVNRDPGSIVFVWVFGNLHGGGTREGRRRPQVGFSGSKRPVRRVRSKKAFYVGRVSAEGGVMV
ncbi:hypothetical protein C8J57DRAFT_1210554 [Mycena rebaudengoi]|nr:hypothetical protein C8J57DRAFT_1210554 [Mycena rebaudengoi]